MDKLMKRQIVMIGMILGMTVAAFAVKPVRIKNIKSYCLDFNWGEQRSFAKPGTWAEADPAAHVAWYKDMGVNVIQTFAVSCNGYAWYKNGFVPEQPGLKNDFLSEVVKLGHKEGMLVFGYFCIASNPKWAKENPELSYGAPSTYHIPYTDKYLDYLASSIKDAINKTGMDGFMIDWVWMPNRTSTKNKWLECEKQLYKQLMAEDFPGEELLTEESPKYIEYSRKAIDRCWKAIRKAAKSASPSCIIWLTSNNTTHPHVVQSDMYKETDWLMNESGSIKGVTDIKTMVGKHTRLITCLARWNGEDATKVVPEALKAGIGLYGFTKPYNKDGLISLDEILSRPVSDLKDDNRNIAVLARAYHGLPIGTVWKNGKFVAPAK